MQYERHLEKKQLVCVCLLFLFFSSSTQKKNKNFTPYRQTGFYKRLFLSFHIYRINLTLIFPTIEQIKSS